jgi:hypothetical protein
MNPVLLLPAANPDAAASQPLVTVCSSRISTTHCPQLRERCKLLPPAAVLVFARLALTAAVSASKDMYRGNQGTALPCPSNEVGQNRALAAPWVLFAAPGVGTGCAGVLAAAATRLVRKE